MKKTMASLMAVMMLASMSTTIFAAENHTPRSEPVPVVAIREDVTLNEALNDKTFSFDESQQTKEHSRGAEWEFGGERLWMEQGHSWGAKPYGWSQQVNTDTGEVENTYHYTNVYFHYLKVSKRGASGRVWGHGRVEATGTFCEQDIVDASVLTVKYGVSND